MGWIGTIIVASFTMWAISLFFEGVDRIIVNILKLRVWIKVWKKQRKDRNS